MAPAKNVVAVFDLDGTLTRRDTYLWFLQRQLVRRPARWVQVLPLSMQVAAFHLGRVGNHALKEAFLRKVLGGVERAQLARWSESFARIVITEGVTRAARAEVDEHRRAGHRLVLATASPNIYADRIGELLGFDDCVATACGWTPDGLLTGRLAGPNLRGEAKLKAVRQKLGPSWRHCHIYAYSDHDSDIPLLAAAQKPVAVNPSKALHAYAVAHNIEIRYWVRST